ncbi:MAG: SRPBCC family protein [Acidimicrobiales bacterium]
MDRPVVIELATDLPAPPEVVWELITDWENQGDWMLEATDFEVVSPQREGVGVEAEATVVIAGIRTRDRVRVVTWEPPARLGIEHLGWVEGRADLVLAPVGDDGTRVTWTEALRCPSLGPLGWAGLSAVRPIMSRVFRRDLRVLVGLARARHGRRPTA